MQPGSEVTLDTRYRTMVTLWFGLFFSIVVFFLFALLTSPAEATENSTVSLVLAIIGTLAVIASYLVKQRFLSQAVEKQNVAMVQTGMIVAAALTEIAAMLGLLDHFTTGNRWYYLLMIVAVIGALLNFPKRDHLLAASYKDPNTGVMRG